jgi:hypothetical protein
VLARGSKDREQGGDRQTDSKPNDTVNVTFWVGEESRTRAVDSTDEAAELLRYSIAATSEELVRATWAELGPKRFFFSASAVTRALSSTFIGAAVTFGLRIAGRVTLVAELAAALALTRRLTGDVPLSASLFVGSLGAWWHPLEVGRLRFGPSASFEMGSVVAGIDAQQGALWTALTGSLRLAFQVAKFFEVQALAGGGLALSGSQVTNEGRRIAAFTGGFFSAEAGFAFVF